MSETVFKNKQEMDDHISGVVMSTLEAWQEKAKANGDKLQVRDPHSGQTVEADELIRETLSEAADDEEAQARALWLRKFGTPPAEQKERARQLRFLAGRGFSLSVIYKVVGGESNDDL